MKKIELAGVEYDLAQEFEEVRKEDLEYVLQISVSGKKYMNRKSWELLVIRILKINEKVWDGILINIDDWIALKGEFEWIWEKKLTFEPFEYLKQGAEKLWLPDALLEKVTALQMAIGLIYYQQLTSGDADAANSLLATFCLPKKRTWWGDEKNELVKFKDHEVEIRAKVVKKTDTWKKMVALKFISDSLLNFIEQYKEMFGEGGVPKYDDGSGWLYMLKNVAKNGYFESVEVANDANAAYVWGLMLDDALDAKQLMEKQ